MIDRKSFYQEVYEVVGEIPRGSVSTYGQIARLLGKPQYSRMVGHAMCEAPASLKLPCHRVVNSQGRLVPGWDKQRELLCAEGVAFKKNACVDLKKCLWKLF